MDRALEVDILGYGRRLTIAMCVRQKVILDLSLEGEERRRREIFLAREQHEWKLGGVEQCICGRNCKHFHILMASSGRWEPAGSEAGKVATGQAMHVFSSLSECLALLTCSQSVSSP